MARTRTQTPEETATLARIKEEEAAGGDPFGDNEDIVAESIDDQAAAAKVKLDKANGVDPDAPADDAEDAAADAGTEGREGDAAGKEGEGKEKPAAGAEGDDKAGKEGEGEQTEQTEQTAAAGDDFGDDEDAPLEPRGWTGTSVADLTKRDGEIRTELAAKFKAYSDGELDADEYTKAIEPLQDEQRKIDRTIARAESAQDAVAQYEKGVVNQIAREAAKQGVVYVAPKDADDATKAAASKASKQYDVALGMLLSDPDNARRSFRSLAKEAHASVLAIRGIKRASDTPAPPTVPTGKPPARDPAKAPVTLRQVPAAATGAAGGQTIADQGKALKGQAYEAWYSKLSPKQKAELLDD